MELHHPAQLLERLVDVADAQTLPRVVGHPSFPLSLHLLLWSQVFIVVVATMINDGDEQAQGEIRRRYGTGEEQVESVRIDTERNPSYRKLQLRPDLRDKMARLVKLFQ